MHWKLGITGGLWPSWAERRGWEAGADGRGQRSALKEGVGGECHWLGGDLPETTMASFGPQVKNMVEAAAGGDRTEAFAEGKGPCGTSSPSYPEHRLPLPPPSPLSAPVTVLRLPQGLLPPWQLILAVFLSPRPLAPPPHKALPRPGVCSNSAASRLFSRLRLRLPSPLTFRNADKQPH